jgi:protein TonB
MVFRRFAQHRLPSLVLGVLLLHALALWVLQSGLLQRAAPPEPPVVQLSYIAAPVPVPVPVPKAMAEPPPPTVKTPPARTPVPTSAMPAPVAAAAAAPSPVAVATALPSAPQGVAVAPVPAGAAIGLAQTPASPAPVAAPPAARVVLPSVDADYLYPPKPEYPHRSAQLNEHGRVLISVFIGTDGVAQKAEVKQSSSFARLDQAALTFALGQRYIPGKVGGAPEAMWFVVPVKFGLVD